MFSKKRIMMFVMLSLILMLSLIIPSLVAEATNHFAEADSLPISESILDETYLAGNQFTQPDDLTAVGQLLTIPENYLKIGETNDLILYMEEGSYAIRVVNKNDNFFIHGSSFGKTGDNYDYLGTTWEENVNSAVVLSYYIYNADNGEYTIIEESLLASKDSTSTYELIDNGFEARLYFGKSKVELTLRVYLKDNYLQVEIPNDSIKENQYQLRSIKVYQFMGAVFENSVPGYIFVPDGSGALIRYQGLNVHTDTYNFQYYGNDETINPETENEPILAFPVTGVVQGINQHAFMTIVEDGAEYANFSVSPAKNNLRFYFSFNEFRYRNLYRTPRSESQADNQTGTQVTQDNLNHCNVVIKYRFLENENANYVGMAKAYQDYLLSTERLDNHLNKNSEVSLMIEVIGGEKKAGFIFDEYLVLTNLNELSNILSTLGNDLSNMTVIYKGFTKGGATSSGLEYNQLYSKLGSKGEYQNLLTTLDLSHSSIYFYLDHTKVYEEGKFNLYKDITQRINQNFLFAQGIEKNYYYVSPQRIKLQYLDSIKSLLKNNITSYAVDTVGYQLYSDFKDKENAVERDNMIEIIQSMFEESPTSQVLYRPNDYLLKYTESYLNMPLSSSRYRIYSDSVPFMSYVLAGVMDSYSPFMNFSSFGTTDLLKMVDYNIYPSYIITEKSAYLLQDTELGQIYSSSFGTWKETMVYQTRFVKDALDSIRGSHVLSRVTIESGFYRVSYSNGVQIYINYTNNPLTDGSTIVQARNYKVVMPNG